MRAKALDVIAPLDAAFELDTDEATWIQRVTDTLMPLLDLGLGTFAWLACPVQKAMPFERLLHLNAPVGGDFVLQMHDDADRDDIALAYPNITGVHSLATLFGPRRYFESPLLRRWIHARKIADAGGLHISLGGRTLVAGAVFHEVAAFPRPLKTFGPMLSRRIEAAFRLRQGLATMGSTPAAVLTPAAQVVHAENEAKSTTVRERLRRAVVAREMARGLREKDPARAFALYEGIVSGRFTILDRFERDGRRYLVAYENPPDVLSSRALTRREREVMWRAAQGEPLKRVAIELGITPSAAAAYFHAARKKTGIRSRNELVRWFRGLESS